MKDIAQVRDSIKQSAAELFEKFGYDKTTLDDIARRADKAKTLVYYHFGGKLDLLKGAVADEFKIIRETLAPEMSETPGSIVRQFGIYLEERMDLLNDARVYRKFAVDSLLSDSGEVNRAVRAIRDEFDRWEMVYFKRIAQLGREFGVFSEAVDPESFGNMVMMLLKGLEVQFFVNDNWASYKSTFTEVLQRLLKGCMPAGQVR